MAHELVDAVVEAIRASHDEKISGDIRIDKHYKSNMNNGLASRRRRVDPERIAARLERSGFTSSESLLIALAVNATVASPVREGDVDWTASAAARIDDADLLLETAGVVFAFNTINRIADARRVRLEYRFLRKWKPIRGWVERRLASVTGIAYDLSFKYQPRHSPEKLLGRLDVLFEGLGAPDVPDLFHWLSQSTSVLEGIYEMVEANVTGARVRLDLWKEAAAIAVASRAMPGSGLSRAADQWLSQGSLPDSNTLLTLAAPSGIAIGSDLVAACRRYAWQVANAAYTITDEQICRLRALGLPDAELLDLTLATALFSALSIIEPLNPAFATTRIDEQESSQPTLITGVL